MPYFENVILLAIGLVELLAFENVKNKVSYFFSSFELNEREIYMLTEPIFR